MARIWHPLLIKIGARVQEPLSFKGGRYADIYKGTGDRRNCAMSRSVFLANGISKQHHRLVRAKLVPYLQRYSLEIVCVFKGAGRT